MFRLTPYQWKKSICYTVISALAFYSFSIMAQPTIDPPTINLGGGSAVCSGGSETIPLSITLPPDAVNEKVDVFFLFDDTGSFAPFVRTVTSIFGGLVGDLETALPGVEFGFGVGRFEDYGGPGTGFSAEVPTGRPFTLNQPIITAADADGAAARDALINAALDRTAPGGGGDGPESAVAEGLFQTATGIGFEGDGNGSTLDSGPAGLAANQTSPGTSGDVPAFSSNVAPTSGALGGAGWRSDTLRLTILATDICPVAAFPAGASIPATITGAGAASVPVSAFACSSTEPGDSRFGFVSNSKTLEGNTVEGAVVPSDAGTVQNTVDALNTLGIRVLGMGPGTTPTDSTGPAIDESVFLSALARLTGALDATGDPLVFSTSVSLPTLRDAIVGAITTTATAPVDITLARSALPAGLVFGFSPAVVDDVPPRGRASFTVTLTGDGTPIFGSFEINFLDANSGAVLGSVPATVGCTTNVRPTASSPFISGTPQVGQVLTGSYIYGDVDGDLEGASTFRWLRDNVVIAAATAQSYALVAADEGALIRFEVTPVAQSGASPGLAVTSAAVGPVIPEPDPPTPPTASSVSISGTPRVGQVLTGSYTYGDVEGDLQGASTFRWLRDNVVIAGATAQSYALVAADEGALIRFEVTPVAQSGPSPGLAVTSAPVGPVTPEPDPPTPPTASSVSISGAPQVGQVLTGSYTYADTEGDLEGASTFRWLRDNVAIAGATAQSYALVAADEGALIRLQVTPVAQSGPSPGLAVTSAAVGPVTPTLSRDRDDGPPFVCNGSRCLVPLKCNAVGTSCTARVTLFAFVARARLSDRSAAQVVRSRIRFAAAVVNVPPGETRTVRLRLTPRGRRIVNSATRRILRGVLEIRNSAGGIRNIPIRIRIRVRR